MTTKKLTFDLSEIEVRVENAKLIIGDISVPYSEINYVVWETVPAVGFLGEKKTVRLLWNDQEISIYLVNSFLTNRSYLAKRNTMIALSVGLFRSTTIKPDYILNYYRNKLLNFFVCATLAFVVGALAMLVFAISAGSVSIDSIRSATYTTIFLSIFGAVLNYLAFRRANRHPVALTVENYNKEFNNFF